MNRWVDILYFLLFIIIGGLVLSGAALFINGLLRHTDIWFGLWLVASGCILYCVVAWIGEER